MSDATSTIPVDQVLGAVARLHGIHPERLVAPDGPTATPVALRETVWLAYRHLDGYTAPRLGRLLALPRSQVTRLVREVDTLRRTDPNTVRRLATVIYALPDPRPAVAA